MKIVCLRCNRLNMDINMDFRGPIFISLQDRCWKGICQPCIDKERKSNIIKILTINEPFREQ